MNRSLLLSFILIVILTIACSDDKKDTILEPGENSTGNFYAEIDGNQFEATKVKAYKQGNYKIIEGIQILQTNSNGLNEINIKILIRNLNVARIYAIGEDGSGFIYNAKATLNFVSNNFSDTLTYYGIYVQDLSLINITDLTDDSITGNVTFRTTDKDPVEEHFIDVLEGRFHITF